jgi:tetratricopeptide (TPR) repeat protein
MKLFFSVLFAFSFCASMCATAVAQHSDNMAAPAKPATLVSGIGEQHHPVSTTNAEAQQFFDQGLRYIYAFNHDEAARSFQHAAELDPSLAMAYWGVAEAVGPNYNDPASEDRFKQAHEAIAKAHSLDASATPSEREYIAALAKRFPAYPKVGDPKADLRKAAEAYRDAMRELVKHQPDDLDAATLFAEAGMNLHPWGLWHHDGTPEVGTEEIVATLESVIKRDPNHVGANHYYIHAVEASNTPERALPSANRLAALAPGAGHLVHMPAHTYIRTGDFDAAERTNIDAAKVDEAYIAATGAQGMYPMMYYSHNLHFIATAAAMEGRYADSWQAADKLAAHVAPGVKDVPPLEGFMTVPIMVRVRFQKWDEILAMPAPDAAMQTTTAFWHFARGMAFAGKGKIAEAEAEYKIVSEKQKGTPPDEIFAMPVNNKTKTIFTIARDALGAKIAVAKKDLPGAIVLLRESVTAQDSLNYNEPSDWLYPLRESLGAALLMNGKAVEAEQVFRDDLAKNPRNPRSLFGLSAALKAQKRDYDAQFVDKQFQDAWKKADVEVRVEDLV